MFILIFKFLESKLGDKDSASNAHPNHVQLNTVYVKYVTCCLEVAWLYFRFQKSKTQYPLYQRSNLTTHRFSTTDIRSYKPAHTMRTAFLYMEAKIQRVMSAKLQNLHKWNSTHELRNSFKPCCGRPQVSSLARDSAVCCGYMFRSSNLWFRFGGQGGCGSRYGKNKREKPSDQNNLLCEAHPLYCTVFCTILHIFKSSCLR